MMMSPSALLLGGMKLLPKCAVYIQLLKLVSTMEAGDHDVALCKVDGTGIWDESPQKVVMTEMSGSIGSDDALVYCSAAGQRNHISWLFRQVILRSETRVNLKCNDATRLLCQSRRHEQTIKQ